MRGSRADGARIRPPIHRRPARCRDGPLRQWLHPAGHAGLMAVRPQKSGLFPPDLGILMLLVFWGWRGDVFIKPRLIWRTITISQRCAICCCPKGPRRTTQARISAQRLRGQARMGLHDRVSPSPGLLSECAQPAPARSRGSQAHCSRPLSHGPAALNIVAKAAWLAEGEADSCPAGVLSCARVAYCLDSCFFSFDTFISLIPCGF